MADELLQLLRETKSLAQRYYRLTSKPLGVTGEVAEYEASRLLGVRLSDARQAGFDAVGDRDGVEITYQIKGRCFDVTLRSGQRVGSLSLKKKWDAVLLVLLDPNFETRAIWEASRSQLTPALTRPGSRARLERGQIGVNQFLRVASCVWRRPA